MKNNMALIVVRTMIPVLIGGTVLACGNLIGGKNHYITAFLLIILAVALYIYCVFVLSSKNWMDIRAVFSGAWIGTIGLAALRLTEYQEPWQNKTWIMMGLAYGMFLLGASVGTYCGKGFLLKVQQKINRISVGRFRFQFHENRLFWICVITTFVGFACFVINVAIKGYIPCFVANGSNEYVDFYTKFYLFAVASTGISGLCYFCLKSQSSTLIKKIVLLLCIFYSTFVFPILIVSRGTFVTSALSLATVIFYLHRKKLVVLVFSIALILGVYYVASQLRGYTDDQLKIFFEPAVITQSTEEPPVTEPPVTEPPVTEPPSTEPPSAEPPSTEPPATEPPSTEPPSTEPPVTEPPATESPATEPPVTEPPATEPPVTEPLVTEPLVTEPPSTFQLSPKLAFLYSYLTVSHDNFNEAVQNTVGYTYGARQFAPFNVIVRSEKINQVIADGEYYLVRDHLNTTNLIGDFYYDFHGVGVVVCMFLWAFVFGVIQSSCDVFKGPFALMVLGNSMTPIALCFFATWLSVFSHWMHWGVVLLIAIAACITRKPLKAESELKAKED